MNSAHRLVDRLSNLLRATVAVLCSIAVASPGVAHAQGGPTAPEREPGMAACGPAGTISYDDHEATVLRLRLLYRSGKFGDLDAALGCLLEERNVFRSGRPGSGAAYWMFRREFPGPGVAQGEAEAMVKAWRAQRPSSIFAEFAALRLMYASAWNARGSSYAYAVPAQDMGAFEQGMLSTENALLQATKELRDTPIWHNLLLATTLDSPRPLSNPENVLSAALLRWPKYYDFYEVALSRMVPKWGGSWTLVDRFIKHHGASRKSSEGDSMYARLYWNVVASGAAPEETLLSWPRMKASLMELVERYPDPVHKNVAASFACVYGDLAYSRQVRSQLRSHEVVASIWLRGTDPVSCPS